MKKYAQHTYLLLVICLFIVFSLAGCKARKSVARSVVVESTVERVETTTDTSRITLKTELNIQTQEATQDNTFIRTTEFDSTGTVIRSIREEWRDVRSAQLSVLDRQEDYLSITGTSTFVSERDSTVSTTIEISKTETDSRLIQGVEWLWIVIGIKLILIIVLLFYAQKKWRR
jgi:hypothetical protein